MAESDVCLQINLAPGDLRYVSEILPHHLRTWGGQVQEIQFTLDTNQSRAFRSATDGYADKLEELRRLLLDLCSEFPKASIVEVDYSPACLSEVAHRFLAAGTAPKKACDGSAFYAYLYGMARARSNFILHMDSDMLYGGGSQTWVAEALQLLKENESILACYPFPGPPRADGKASHRRLISLWNDVSFAQSCYPSDLQRGAYSYNEVSTRIFLMDRRRFGPGALQIPLVRSRGRRFIRSFWIRTSPYLLLEDCITVLMNTEGLRCIGFLGSGAGMWSLHSRYRSEQFYAQLPEFVSRVESGDVPDGQRGDFDMNGSMIDISEATRGMTRWRRFRKELRLVAFGIADRVLGG
jgi:hypothetical protein